MTACWGEGSCCTNCRWSCPHTCLCIPQLLEPHSCTITHFTPPLIKRLFLHLRYSPPWAYMMWKLRVPPSDQNTCSLIKGHRAESLRWTTEKKISEPVQLMTNVLLHCCAIGGLHSLYLPWLDFSCFCCTCKIRHLIATFSGSTCSRGVGGVMGEQENFSQPDVPRTGFQSHPTIIQHRAPFDVLNLR